MKPPVVGRILWAAVILILEGCSTLAGDQSSDFSLRVASGTITLKVESRIAEGPPSGSGLTSKNQSTRAVPHPAGVPTEVQTVELLSAGQSYRYSLTAGERFSALIQRTGDEGALVEVFVRGVKTVVSLPSTDLLGRSFSLTRGPS